MCITSVELSHLSARQRGRVLMAWQDELVAKVLQYEREAGLRPPQDLDFEIPSHVHGGPSIHQWQGRKLKAAIPREPVKEYIVVDIISSHVNGVTVKLQDLSNGKERVVPEEDFEEMVRFAEILPDDDSEED
ncbi:hypothetical protein EWM64_g10192 [Hericium alpestre]|uniref:Uncharacterized protein n=1 Tax=Hericium alpestre TaxID=135208 RepID=A0A4Y9ZGU0_9AGAM|nr:hypothetical protein EWM64_g10192 [Hericium alpestre]